MAVKNETIIKKMKDELNRAETQVANKLVMNKHIANVQLLGDLLLDEETEQFPTEELTQQEIKAMVGATGETKRLNNQKIIQSLHKSDTNEGNGDSIFDF